MPIGIIRAAKGSTNVESWLSREAISAAHGMMPLADNIAAAFADWESAKQRRTVDIKRADAVALPSHHISDASAIRPHCATRCKAMIAPFSGMALRGIVWHQDEHNALNPQLIEAYPDAQRALVDSWRTSFSDENLPFLKFQLTNYGQSTGDPGLIKIWALMRESLARCLDIPDTYMAVTIDIGQAEDIHPSSKYDVGQRLAALSMQHVYGKEEVVPGGPMFKGMTIADGKAVISLPGSWAGSCPASRRSAVRRSLDRIDGRSVSPSLERTGNGCGPMPPSRATRRSSPHLGSSSRSRCATRSARTRPGLPAAPFRTDAWLEWMAGGFRGSIVVRRPRPNSSAAIAMARRLATFTAAAAT